MKQFLWIISFFVILVKCVGLDCPTCQGPECFKSRIQNLKCDNNFPALPFQVELKPRRNHGDNQYGCLELHYYTGKTLYTIKQCFPVIQNNCICKQLRQIVHVKQCTLSGKRQKRSKQNSIGNIDCEEIDNNKDKRETNKDENEYKTEEDDASTKEEEDEKNTIEDYYNENKENKIKEKEEEHKKLAENKKKEQELNMGENGEKEKEDEQKNAKIHISKNNLSSVVDIVLSFAGNSPKTEKEVKLPIIQSNHSGTNNSTTLTESTKMVTNLFDVSNITLKPLLSATKITGAFDNNYYTNRNPTLKESNTKSTEIQKTVNSKYFSLTKTTSYSNINKNDKDSSTKPPYKQTKAQKVAITVTTEVPYASTTKTKASSFISNADKNSSRKENKISTENHIVINNLTSEAVPLLSIKTTTSENGYNSKSSTERNNTSTMTPKAVTNASNIKGDTSTENITISNERLGKDTFPSTISIAFVIHNIANNESGQHKTTRSEQSNTSAMPRKKVSLTKKTRGKFDMTLPPRQNNLPTTTQGVATTENITLSNDMFIKDLFTPEVSTENVTHNITDNSSGRHTAASTSQTVALGSLKVLPEQPIAVNTGHSTDLPFKSTKSDAITNSATPNYLTEMEQNKSASNLLNSTQTTYFSTTKTVGTNPPENEILQTKIINIYDSVNKENSSTTTTFLQETSSNATLLNKSILDQVKTPFDISTAANNIFAENSVIPTIINSTNSGKISDNNVYNTILHSTLKEIPDTEGDSVTNTLFTDTKNHISVTGSSLENHKHFASTTTQPRRIRKDCNMAIKEFTMTVNSSPNEEVTANVTVTDKRVINTLEKRTTKLSEKASEPGFPADRISRVITEDISRNSLVPTPEIFHDTHNKSPSLDPIIIENIISSSPVTESIESSKPANELSSQETYDIAGATPVATDMITETTFASRVITKEITSNTFVPSTENFHFTHNESNSLDLTIIEYINSSSPGTESAESFKPPSNVSSQDNSDITGSTQEANEVKATVASRDITEEIPSNTFVPKTEYLLDTNESSSFDVTISENIIGSSPVKETPELSKQTTDISSHDTSDLAGDTSAATERIMETTVASRDTFQEISSKIFGSTIEYFHKKSEGTSIEVTTIENLISSSGVTKSPESPKKTHEVSSQDTSEITGSILVATEGMIETSAASRAITEEISSNTFIPLTEYFHDINESTTREVTIIENINSSSPVSESPESSKEANEVSSQHTSDMIPGSIPLATEGIIETSVASRVITEEISSITVLPTTEYLHKTNEDTSIEVTIIESVISSSPVTESIESSKQNNEVSSQDTSDITGPIPVATEKIIEATLDSGVITEEIFSNTFITTTEYFRDRNESTDLEITIIEHKISSSPVTESPESSKQTNEVSSQDTSDFAGATPVATEKIMETTVASRDIADEISSSPFGPTTECFHKTNEGTSLEVTMAENIMVGSAVTESPESSKLTHEVSSQDTSDITESILLASGGIIETSIASRDITEEVSNNPIVPTAEYFHKMNEGTIIEITIIDNVISSSPVTESIESFKQTNETSSQDTSDITGSVPVATERITETTAASRDITEGISCNTVIPTTDYFHKTDEGTSIEVTIVENIISSSTVAESPESSKRTNAVSSQDISDITGSIPMVTERIMETKVASREITEEISSSPFKPTTEYFQKTNEGTSLEVTMAENIMVGSAVTESPESSKLTHEVSSQDTSDITGSILLASGGIMETTVPSSDITEEISSNTVLETTEYFQKTNEGTSFEVTLVENIIRSSTVTESPESTKLTNELSSQDTSDFAGSIPVVTERIMETKVASREITEEISSSPFKPTTDYFHKTNEGTSLEVTIAGNIMGGSAVSESPESSKQTHKGSSQDTSGITGSILVATEGIMETTVASSGIAEEISSNTVLETTEYFHKMNEGTTFEVTLVENIIRSSTVTESPESSKQTNELSSRDTSDFAGAYPVATERIMGTTVASRDIAEEISSSPFRPTTEYFHKTNEATSLEVTVAENIMGGSAVSESPESSKHTHEVSSQDTSDITGSIFVATEGIMETTVASNDITEEVSNNADVPSTEYFHKTNKGTRIEVTVIENITSSSPVTESPESSKQTLEGSSQDTSGITVSILVATEGIMETTVASSDITEEISSNTVLETTEYFHKTNEGTSFEVTLVENIIRSSTVTESPESSKQTNELSSQDTSDLAGAYPVATERVMETTVASREITKEISSSPFKPTTEYFQKTNEGTSLEVTMAENIMVGSAVTESPESSKQTHEVSSQDTSDITESILVASEGLIETSVASTDITEDVSNNTVVPTTEYFHKTNEITSLDVTIIQNIISSSPVTESIESSKQTNEISSQDTSDITGSVPVATDRITETTAASRDITEGISCNTVVPTTDYFHKTDEGTSIEVTIVENIISSSTVTESPESSKRTNAVSSQDISDITGSIPMVTERIMETKVASRDITEEISSNTVLETTEYFQKTNEGTSFEVTIVENIISSSTVTESPESSKQTNELSSQDSSDFAGSIPVVTERIMETKVASREITEEISSSPFKPTTDYFHKTNEGTSLEVTIAGNIMGGSAVSESPESSKQTHKGSSQDTSGITGSILVATEGIMETTVASSDITEEISSNTVLETTEYFHKTNEGTSFEVTLVENIIRSSTVTESPESSKQTNELSSQDTSDFSGAYPVATERIMGTTVASRDIAEEISSSPFRPTTEYFHKTNEATSIEVTVAENIMGVSAVSESPESSKQTHEVSSQDTSDITGSILVTTEGIMETTVASNDITEEVSNNTDVPTTEYFHKTNEGTRIEVTVIENITCSSPITESPESSKQTHEGSSQDTSGITGSILVATEGIMETTVASSDITEEISSNTVLETTEYFHKTNEGTSFEVTLVENIISSSTVTESPESSKQTNELSSQDTSDLAGAYPVATERVMETTVASREITEEISSSPFRPTTEYFHKTNEATSLEVTVAEDIMGVSAVSESPESSKQTHEVSSQDTSDITGSILVATEGIMETTVASNDITEEVSNNTDVPTTEYFHKTNEGTRIEVTVIENITFSSPITESPESSKQTHEGSSQDTSGITGSILVATEGIMETTVASSDITEEISSNTVLETTEYFHKTNEGTSFEVTLVENIISSSTVTESPESSKQTNELSSQDTSDLAGAYYVATERAMETTVASREITEEISSSPFKPTTEYFQKTNEGTSLEVTMAENIMVGSAVTESPESSKQTHEVSSQDTSDITGSILVTTEGIMETTVASNDITEEVSNNTDVPTTEYFHKTNEGTRIEVTVIENITCSSPITESPESSKQTHEGSSQNTSGITGSILVATEGIMETTVASSDITEEISSNTVLETTEYFHKTNEGTSFEVTLVENIISSSTVTESPESSKQTNELSSQDTSDLAGAYPVATERVMETTVASREITEEISSSPFRPTTEYFHKTNEATSLEVTVAEDIMGVSAVSESPESSKQTHEVSSQDTSDITGSILVATEGIMETTVASNDITEEVSNNTDVPTTEYFHKTNEGTRIEVTVIENITFSSPITESPESSKQTHEGSSQDTSGITGSILVATEGIMETTVASSDITEEISSNTVLETTEYFHKTNEGTSFEVTLVENIISSSRVTESPESSKQTNELSSQDTSDLAGAYPVATERVMETTVASREITEEISSSPFKPTTEYFQKTNEGTSLEVTMAENIMVGSAVTESPESSKQTHEVSSQDTSDITESILVASEGLIETSVASTDITEEVSNNTVVPTTEYFHKTNEITSLDVTIIQNIISGSPVAEMTELFKQTFEVSSQGTPDITEEISSNTLKLTTEDFHNTYESTSLDVTITENMLSSISVTKSPESSKQTPGISSQDYFDLAETTLVATDGLIETTSVFGVMTKETSSNTLVPVTTEAFHITKESAAIDVIISENVISSGPVTKFSGSSTQTSGVLYQDISDIAGATQVSTEGILETTAASSVFTEDISSITSTGIKESSEKMLEITSALNNVETASTKSITDRTEPSSQTLLLTNIFSTHITTEKIFDIPTTELPVSSQKFLETISPTPDTSDLPFGTKFITETNNTFEIPSITSAKLSTVTSTAVMIGTSTEKPETNSAYTIGSQTVPNNDSSTTLFPTIKEIFSVTTVQTTVTNSSETSKGHFGSSNTTTVTTENKSSNNPTTEMMIYSQNSSGTTKAATIAIEKTSTSIGTSEKSSSFKITTENTDRLITSIATTNNTFEVTSASAVISEITSSTEVTTDIKESSQKIPGILNDVTSEKVTGGGSLTVSSQRTTKIISTTTATSENSFKSTSSANEKISSTKSTTETNASSQKISETTIATTENISSTRSTAETTRSSQETTEKQSAPGLSDNLDYDMLNNSLQPTPFFLLSLLPVMMGLLNLILDNFC